MQPSSKDDEWVRNSAASVPAEIILSLTVFSVKKRDQAWAVLRSEERALHESTVKMELEILANGLTVLKSPKENWKMLLTMRNW